jgi:hypothetical protein
VNTENHPEYFRVDVADMKIDALVRAHDIWASRCIGDHVPVWGDLDFLDFESNIIPYMMLVDIDGEPGYGRYRFWGSRVASADERTMTGLRIADLSPQRHAEYSEEQYRWVVENAKPALFVSCLWEKTWNQKFEAVLRLPCRSSAESGIDRVLAVGFYSTAMHSIADYVDANVDLGDYFGVDK